MDQTSDKEAGYLHRELAFSGNMIPQVSPEKQIHHKVKVHCVLEREVHVHDEIALDQRKQLEFVHYTRYALLGNNSCLSHLFHGKLFAFVLLGLDSPYFAKSAATHGVNLLEIRLAGLDRTFLVLGCFEVAVAHLSFFSHANFTVMLSVDYKQFIFYLFVIT